MDSLAIKKTSPLYDYWINKQDDLDEDIRLRKANKKNPQVRLFANEPYKWESLYQSIIRRIINGDRSSIKGLNILLDMINSQEKELLLKKLFSEGLLERNVIYDIKINRFAHLKKTQNFLTFISILVTIFVNPYDINIKRKPNHIYEKTAIIFFNIRKISDLKLNL